MGEEKSVKLHGFWAGPFAMRATIALKVKGIEFEYIEEDLKSLWIRDLLLKYNPVHKKVPILFHNGHPISESMVILEYIDEVWTDPPHLLPKDPYIRAKHRFWAAFLDPAVNELLEKMDVAEEGLKEIFPNGVPSFEDVKPGYLDIVFYSLYGTHEAAEGFFGKKFLTEERYPLLVSWVNALGQVPEVKEVTPPIPKLVEFFPFIPKFESLKQSARPTRHGHVTRIIFTIIRGRAQQPWSMSLRTCRLPSPPRWMNIVKF
ncbi:hypothetical protein RND81_13G118300 [Saponaria officinalis]|uniref:glutathione transferase n=1 Tax=Saponaria officinalis TaxID=3572 RepID=A0AAW1GWN5_SAPOF